MDPRPDNHRLKGSGRHFYPTSSVPLDTLKSARNDCTSGKKAVTLAIICRSTGIRPISWPAQTMTTLPIVKRHVPAKRKRRRRSGSRTRACVPEKHRRGLTVRQGGPLALEASAEGIGYVRPPVGWKGRLPAIRGAAPPAIGLGEASRCRSMWFEVGSTRLTSCHEVFEPPSRAGSQRESHPARLDSMRRGLVATSAGRVPSSGRCGRSSLARFSSIA